MRKAQAQHALYYIFALLIIGLLILIGYKGTDQVQTRGAETNLLQFETQLRSDLETIQSRYGAYVENTYFLPESFDEICFIDLSKKNELQQSYNIQNEYKIIYDSLVSGSPNAVFALGKEVKAYDFGTIHLDAYPYYACFKNINGRIKIGLKGEGRATGIFTDFIARTSVSPSQSVTLKSPDEKITLTIPAGLQADGIDVEEVSIQLVLPDPNSPFQSETYRFLAKDDLGTELDGLFNIPIALSMQVSQCRSSLAFNLDGDRFPLTNCQDNQATFAILHFSEGGLEDAQCLSFDLVCPPPAFALFNLNVDAQGCPLPPTCCGDGLCDDTLETHGNCPNDCEAPPLECLLPAPAECSENQTAVFGGTDSNGCLLSDTCCGNQACERQEDETNCPQDCQIITNPFEIDLESPRDGKTQQIPYLLTVKTTLATHCAYARQPIQMPIDGVFFEGESDQTWTQTHTVQNFDFFGELYIACSDIQETHTVQYSLTQIEPDSECLDTDGGNNPNQIGTASQGYGRKVLAYFSPGSAKGQLQFQDSGDYLLTLTAASEQTTSRVPEVQIEVEGQIGTLPVSGKDYEDYRLPIQIEPGDVGSYTFHILYDDPAQPLFVDKLTLTKGGVVLQILEAEDLAFEISLGGVVFASDYKSDSCANSARLIEYSCQENQRISQSLFCENGCEKGACREEPILPNSYDALVEGGDLFSTFVTAGPYLWEYQNGRWQPPTLITDYLKDQGPVIPSQIHSAALSGNLLFLTEKDQLYYLSPSEIQGPDTISELPEWDISPATKKPLRYDSFAQFENTFIATQYDPDQNKDEVWFKHPEKNWEGPRPIEELWKFISSHTTAASSRCGDGVCDLGETCSVDCIGENLCGNGTCDSEENSVNCPEDCKNPSTLPRLLASEQVRNPENALYLDQANAEIGNYQTDQAGYLLFDFGTFYDTPGTDLFEWNLGRNNQGQIWVGTSKANLDINPGLDGNPHAEGWTYIEPRRPPYRGCENIPLISRDAQTLPAATNECYTGSQNLLDIGHQDYRSYQYVYIWSYGSPFGLGGTLVDAFEPVCKETSGCDSCVKKTTDASCDCADECQNGLCVEGNCQGEPPALSSISGMITNEICGHVGEPCCHGTSCMHGTCRGGTCVNLSTGDSGRPRSSTLCGNRLCEAGEANECPTCVYANPPCKAPCIAGSCPEDCPVVCPYIFSPVCGEKQVQCVTEPCLPTQQTYNNRCLLDQDNDARFLYEGACGTGTCGNEQCDDGERECPLCIYNDPPCSTLPCGECPKDCPTIPSCGDGVCQEGESCEWDGANDRQKLCGGDDDEPIPDGAACHNCQYLDPEVCGNGVCFGEETCEFDGTTNAVKLCNGNPLPSGAQCNDCRFTPSDTCTNNLADGDETDLDCGGSCPPCSVGQECLGNNDCASHNCVDGICFPFDQANPHCLNQIPDEDETDLDCGGRDCLPCAVGQECLENGDCDTRNCVAGLCLPEDQVNVECSDRILNQDETDVDCGGELCTDRCLFDQNCGKDSDCLSQVCFEDTCSLPRFCGDGICDADESNENCAEDCAAAENCNQCGDGFFNICDEDECHSIQEGCYYYPYLIEGSCLSCSTIQTCEDYPEKYSCQAHRCLSGMKCEWTEEGGCHATTDCHDGKTSEREIGIDCGLDCQPCPDNTPFNLKHIDDLSYYHGRWIVLLADRYWAYNPSEADIGSFPSRTGWSGPHSVQNLLQNKIS